MVGWWRRKKEREMKNVSLLFSLMLLEVNFALSSSSSSSRKSRLFMQSERDLKRILLGIWDMMTKYLPIESVTVTLRMIYYGNSIRVGWWVGIWNIYPVQGRKGIRGTGMTGRREEEGKRETWTQFLLILKSAWV